MKTTFKNHLGRFILLSGFLFLSSQLFAVETFLIKGKVQNSSNGDIKNVIVTLFHFKTIEPVAISKCNGKGEFNFNNVPEGEYFLVVQKDGISKAKPKIISLDNSGKIVEKRVERTEILQLIDVS